MPTTSVFPSPPSPIKRSAPVTVILKTSRCNANRCFCLEGSFDAPSGNPSMLECSNCQHLFNRHIISPTTVNIPPSTPERRLAKIPEYWCPRKTVVENVFHRMIYHRVLHIRGTPASGKTILRLLLTRHIQLVRPNWHITSQEAWPNGLQGDDLAGTKKFIESRLSLSHDEFFSAQDHVLLVDEAQMTYSNVYFWNTFLKLIDKTQGVYVVLFSSYGSPGRRPIDLVGVTPPILHPDQRISLMWTVSPGFGPVGLLFTREEAAEVVALATEHHQDTPNFAPELLDWLYELSTGHAGALDGLIQILLKAPAFRSHIRSGASITVDLVAPILFNDVTGFSLCERLQHQRFGRGLTTPGDLQDPATNSVLKILACKSHLSESDIPDDNPAFLSALNTCYRNGWIHKTLTDPTSLYEASLYVFPSPIHAWYTSRLLLPRVPNLVRTTFTTPLSLSTAAIRLFNPAQLSSALRVSRTPRESQYGMEFYRALHKLTNGSVLPAPEFGTAAKGGGMIDFLIPAHAWGVELTRDSSGIVEHCSRFEAGGRYAEWIAAGQVADWVVLDFRVGIPTSSAREGSVGVRKLFHICFTDEFREVRVFDQRLALLEQFRLLGE